MNKEMVEIMRCFYRKEKIGMKKILKWFCDSDTEISK